MNIRQNLPMRLRGSGSIQKQITEVSWAYDQIWNKYLQLEKLHQEIARLVNSNYPAERLLSMIDNLDTTKAEVGHNHNLNYYPLRHGVTEGRLAKASNDTILGDSQFHDDGTNVGIGGVPDSGSDAVFCKVHGSQEVTGQLKYNGTYRNVKTFAELKAIVTAAGSSLISIEITDEIELTENYVIPTNVNIAEIGHAGKFTGSYTLSIGKMTADPHHEWIDGPIVTFVSEATPQIFGPIKKKTIDCNFTVPDDYYFISADSIVEENYTVTIDGTWVVL